MNTPTSSCLLLARERSTHSDTCCCKCVVECKDTDFCHMDCEAWVTTGLKMIPDVLEEMTGKTITFVWWKDQLKPEWIPKAGLVLVWLVDISPAASKMTAMLGSFFSLHSASPFIFLSLPRALPASFNKICQSCILPDAISLWYCNHSFPLEWIPLYQYCI